MRASVRDMRRHVTAGARAMWIVVGEKYWQWDGQYAVNQSRVYVIIIIS